MIVAAILGSPGAAGVAGTSGGDIATGGAAVAGKAMADCGAAAVASAPFTADGSPGVAAAG